MVPQNTDWLSAVDNIFSAAKDRASSSDPRTVLENNSNVESEDLLIPEISENLEIQDIPEVVLEPTEPLYCKSWFNIRLIAHPHILGQDAGVAVRPDGSKEIARWVLLPGMGGDEFPLEEEERAPHDYQPGVKPFYSFEDALNWVDVNIRPWESDLAGWVYEGRGRYRPGILGEQLVSACDYDVETTEPVAVSVACGEVTVPGYDICRCHLTQAVSLALPDSAHADLGTDGDRILVDSVWLLGVLNLPVEYPAHAAVGR